MICRRISSVSSTLLRASTIALLAAAVPMALHAGGPPKTTKSAPAKPSAPARPAAKPSAPANHSTGAAGAHTAGTPGSHPGTAAGNNRPGAGAAGNRPGAGTAGNRPGAGGHPTTANRTMNRDGSSTVKTARGGEVTKRPGGKMASYKGSNGHEAKFDNRGHVREVHANGVTVRRGPGNMRHTIVERPDHSRFVAEGHGRGYIQRPYNYGGHAYYSRAYYYHGGYYRSYYRGYYYNGVYLNGYMPAYYYPPAYYGWAYNPWPAPVPYAWGWGGNPWYGYYGAYFAPYPVYPSASFWLADYLVAASLAEAYAAASTGDAAQLQNINPAHLVFASYDPASGTTSATMTTEVKNAVAEEIKRELAAQKTQTQGDNTPASLSTLLADGQPHVFVASTGLSVTSSGQDCNLTEGDVLALNAAPAQGANSADLRVLASKQADCAKGSVITVELTDLQEMHNHLLANIDKGMADMKDHPGKGGLPAPPADAIQGTKEAPYASAAPAADPNGATELDQEAAKGAQAEQEVVAEASADDSDAGSATSDSPIGGVATPTPAVPARPAGPITIAKGQSPEQVIASKGQPTNKVNFPNKMVFIYPDMKIVFVGNKVSDVQ